MKRRFIGELVVTSKSLAFLKRLETLISLRNSLKVDFTNVEECQEGIKSIERKLNDGSIKLSVNCSGIFNEALYLNFYCEKFKDIYEVYSILEKCEIDYLILSLIDCKDKKYYTNYTNYSQLQGQFLVFLDKNQHQYCSESELYTWYKNNYDTSDMKYMDYKVIIPKVNNKEGYPYISKIKYVEIGEMLNRFGKD